MKNFEFVSVFNTNTKRNEKWVVGGEFAKFLNSMKDETDYSLTTSSTHSKKSNVSYFQKKRGILYVTKVNPNSLWWNRRMKLKNLKKVAYQKKG